MKLAIVAIVGVIVGYATGTYTETTTHAYHVARITGTNYFQVLAPGSRVMGAWKKLQTSEMTDTDGAIFDEEVCNGPSTCEREDV